MKSRNVARYTPLRISVYSLQTKLYCCFVAPDGSIAPLDGPQRDFSFSRVLRCLVFQSRCGPIEHGCASPHSTPKLRMGMPCAVSWCPVVMSCSRAVTHPPQEAVISFSIGHSGVSARLRGRRPLFTDKWSSLSPPLTFSIVGANGWCAVWLIGGESHIGRWRFTNANAKLLSIHYSQSMPTQ